MKLISLVIFWTVKIQFRTAAWLNLILFLGGTEIGCLNLELQIESNHVFSRVNSAGNIHPGNLTWMMCIQNETVEKVFPLDYGNLLVPSLKLT